MKAVVQRVLQSDVEVDNESVGRSGPGLLVYLGVCEGDDMNDLSWMIDKVYKLRIFPDSEEKLKYAIGDVAGSVLVISQFTLCADLSKGNRPSFINAADPELANVMYQKFISGLSDLGVLVSSGVFGAHMFVSSINDGPVTIILDSKSKVS